MSDVFNLNRFRKKKARTEKEKQAAENRTKFGRTKAEKAGGKSSRYKLEKHLDDHKVDDE